jgi:FAD synthetase
MSYVDVWRLIHEKHIAYCWLYEHGYTSVGTKKNTVPNPLLKLEDGTYLHADRLRNDADERLGRLKAK